MTPTVTAAEVAEIEGPEPPATRPGADRPVERALVVVKYAQVLRDKWRTAGQKADSDDFLGAISDVCDAVDQFDFGSGRIERGATSPGAAGDAWPHLTAYGEQTPITVSGQTTVPAPAAAEVDRVRALAVPDDVRVRALAMQDLIAAAHEWRNVQIDETLVDAVDRYNATLAALRSAAP